MSYAGESVGKKLARLDFWQRAKLWHGGEFDTLRHLVLASRDGGDIAVLRALGVPAPNILAVDIDQEALDVCRSKYPGVTALHGDVADVLAEQSCLGTAFLDFCGWASDDQIRIVASACLAVRKFGIVAHGFMRGREKGVDTEAIDRERLASLSRARPRFESLGLPNKRLIQEHDGRHGWVLDRLLAEAAKLRVAPYLLWATRYHSTCSWRRGVPMMIVARMVEHFPRCMPENIYARKRDQFGRDWIEGLETHDRRSWTMAQEDGVDPAGAHGWSMQCEITGLGSQERRLLFPIMKRFEGRDVTSIRSLLDAVVVAEELAPGRAHEMLNIRKQRLAAFRAHATRGTYGAIAEVA